MSRKSDNIDEWFEDANHQLNDDMDRLSEIGEKLETFDNMTLGQAITYAYMNGKYDIKRVRVLDGQTGEPIEGATIRVYSDWSSYYYNSADANFTYTTDANGLTPTTKLLRDGHYYINVTADGY